MDSSNKEGSSYESITEAPAFKSETFLNITESEVKENFPGIGKPKIEGKQEKIKAAWKVFISVRELA
jgi:hypothetical protein